MIGVFGTFRYADAFDEQTVRKIVETAHARFEGMSGLHSEAFFSDAVLERVTGLYGVRPSVEFVQIAALVENA
jgi:hypothetical protein